MQGVAAESHGGTDSSTLHSPEFAAASREQRQLGDQVQSSFSMNVVACIPLEQACQFVLCSLSFVCVW